jgi:hypothetical protein
MENVVILILCVTVKLYMMSVIMLNVIMLNVMAPFLFPSDLKSIRVSKFKKNLYIYKTNFKNHKGNNLMLLDYGL